MVFLSAIYPCLDFSQWFIHNATLTETVVTYIQYMPEMTVTPSATAVSAGWPENCLLWIYGAITGILLFRIIVRLLQIVWLHMRCPVVSIEGIRACRLQTRITPFSFFGWIFICPAMHESAEVHEILSHERVHVRQYHSLDILLAELLCTCCWMNPFAWMLKSAIQRNLEFLVDHHVVNDGIDAQSYQYHLLRLACHPSRITLANQFNVSPLKERIMMLNTKRSPKVKLVAYTLLLPLALLFVVANNAGAMIGKMTDGKKYQSVMAKVSDIVAPEDKFEISGILVDAANGRPLSGVNIVVSGTTTGTVSDSEGKFALKARGGDRIVFSHVGYAGFTYTFENEMANTLNSAQTVDIGTQKMNRKKENLDEIVVTADGGLDQEAPPPAEPTSPLSPSIDGEELVFMIVEDMPEFPGGTEELMQFLARNVKYPADAWKEGIQGRVMCSFVISPSGTISNVKVVRGVDPSLDTEALRVIYSMPPWKPGRQRGKAVAVKYSLPIHFRLQDGMAEKEAVATSENTALKNETPEYTVVDRNTLPEGDLLVYVDGKVVPSTIFETLDVKTIENISILKGQTAKDVFPGSRGGVILIQTKKATKEN
jgi:TonB family protein